MPDVLIVKVGEDKYLILIVRLTSGVFRIHRFYRYVDQEEAGEVLDQPYAVTKEVAQEFVNTATANVVGVLRRPEARFRRGDAISAKDANFTTNRTL